MNRKLLWFFLMVVSAYPLYAQRTSTQKKSSTRPSVAEANDQQTYQAPPGKVKWTAGPESMPDNLKAFQENKGQFFNNINDWKILYAADYQGSIILFTDHGVIYTLPELVKDLSNDNDADKGKSSEEEKKEKQAKRKIIYHNVAVEWENVNPDFTIDPQEETRFSFGSTDPKNMGKTIDNIKGFEKLVYRNVYPGIDIEYTFHKDKGIKYAITVHPGYSATDFKMLYSGQQGLSLDNAGDVHITTALGDIIDHAPISFQNGQKIESSFRKTNDNEIAFQLGNIDPKEEIVIDPWTVTPTSAGTLPSDIGMDGANNTYVLSSAGGSMYVQKYTTAGALSWTYHLTQFGTPGYQSDIAVDVAGNTYIPMAYPTTNSLGNYYGMISLNPAGVLRYWWNNDPTPYGTIFEVWNIAYSCDYSELVEGGAPIATQEEVGVVNSANGHVGGVTLNTSYGEIYTGCMAPNGNYYAIAANPCFGCSTPGDDIVCYTIAAGTATFAWNKQSTYQWNDFDNKNPNGISTNGIAASCAYLYTTDGLTLDQRSLANGTSVKSVTIPGGSNALSAATGGLGVDMACGYVYAGTANKVQVYDQNLNAITTQAMGGNVYDVTYNNGLVAACGGSAGSGFVTQFAAQVCATALTITHVNTSCGNNNGTATVATPSFCTGPYTYVWAPGGQTTQTITGLSAGIYTVNVGTSTSCVTVSDTVTIKPSTNVTLTATATGTCTGNITITVSGGVTPYTYSWSNGATTSNITGVSAGSYTITVTDAAGCVKTASATIVGGAVTITTTQVNVLCNGGSTGSSVATASGGTAPYTYSWSNGQTTSTASGLSAGSYTITATSSGGGCSGTATVIITQPPPVTATAANTAALCNGGTGTATVTAGGGTPGYTYSWSNGTTTSTITATAGSYTATVKDANGCTITATTTIAQPTAVTTTISSTPSNCSANNGIASVTAGGGTPGYTYSWSNGKTTSNITALSTGSYTVTVKDANNCTVTATVAVANVGATITATTTPTNILCNGGTGSATVTAPAGGTAPYTYVWSNAQTTTTASPLTVGTYTVTITDANGCTGTETVSITEPTAVTTTTSSTPSNCSASNGTATVTSAGGTPGYTYLWNNGQTSSTASGLSAGAYTVTVKDANNCTVTANVTVTSVGATITATTTPTNVLCNGGTGSATVTGPTGGTAPYTYLWSNAQTTTTATALTIGTYTVTITDVNGCSGTETVTITQPTPVTTTAANTPALCNGGNGTATVTAGGGTPGYTYSWSNGATSSTMNATAGTYVATVTDADGCTITATTTIAQPSAVTATTTNTPPLCNGGNGTATVTAGGGTPGYTYSWSNGTTTSTMTATAGTYVTTVTDANGCTITATTTITQPTVVTATATNTPPLCNGGNGTATVTAGGGTPGYTYSWSNAATTSTMTATAGTYTATVTDANGCTITATTIITEPTVLTTTSSSTPSNCTTSNGTATVTPAGGTPGYTYSWNNGQTTSTATGLSPGPYTVTVTDANGCIIITNITVGNVGATITPTITSTNVLCSGGNTGTASVTATGGTTPYTYLWSTAQTSSNITALTAGSYSVTVTDVFGCTGTANIIITQPTQLRDSIISTVNEPCFGNSLGSITTGEKGGTLPYTYSWTPGGGTVQSPTGMTAGSYTVTVTDANGCVVTANATITQPIALSITAAGFPTSCFGSCDGQVAVIPAGGTTPYTYLWTPSGNTNASQPGMCAGTDSIYVTDNNGCKQNTFVTVTQPSAVRDSIVTIVNVLCNGGNNGSATVGVKGGTAPYGYSWAPSGGTNATANNLTAGVYTVTVTDKDLCNNTVVATITEPPVLVATLPAPSTLCIGQSVTITATVIGGTPNYTYSWSNAATTSSITVSPVVTTIYSVTVTDANGCIVGPISITITVNPPLNVIASPTRAICPGGTATISAVATGGDGTYTYVWTPGNMNGASVNVSPAVTTTYTVTVNDGCGTPAVTATEAVIVDPLPVVSFTADTTNGCYPLCINFKDMTTIASGGVNKWQWTFGNGGTSSHQDTTYCYMTPGQYTVGLTVTSDSGCSSSQTISNMITVYNHPTAMFMSAPQPATIVDPTINFTDQSTDDYGIVKWQWIFGDPLDGTSSKQNPSYTYADTGTYCPNLKVTNKYGCVDSITQCIVIEPFFTLYIPNAFSPNGDGINDIFTAKGTYVCEFQMYIFDRWGMQLFYTEDMQKGWNGTVNGGQTVEQEDTYVYLIYAIDCIEHKKHSYIGKVSIIK